MENQEFSEQQALQLIEQTIKSVRQKVSENGFIFLLWGWFILLGNVLSYLFITLNISDAIGFCWMGIGVSGGIISFIYYAKKEKKMGSPSQLEKYFTYIWSGVGLGAIALYTYFIIAEEYALITPFVLTMAGIATFISGRMMKVSALVWGGISFWIGTAAALYFQSELQFLIGGACMVTGYLIPGYVLRSRHV